MSIDDNYDGDVKVTIIATGFPELTQTEIIKGSSSKNNPFRTGSTASKGNDFVTKALNTPKPASEQPVENPDVPAFLRRKTK